MNMDTNLVLLVIVLVGVLSARGFFKALTGTKSDDDEGPLTKAMKKREE